MVLRVHFKLTLNVINKSLEISEVFLEKSFEFKLYDRSGTLIPVIMLGSFEANSATEI